MAKGFTIGKLQLEILRAGLPLTEASLRNWESAGGNPTTFPFLTALTIIGDDDVAEAARIILDRHFERTGES